MSLILELFTHFSGTTVSSASTDFWKSLGSVLIACAVTIYFFRLNVVGIHESSDKALKIMIVTTLIRDIRDFDVDVVIARMPLATLVRKNGDAISSWSEQVLRQTDCQVFFAAESPVTDVRNK